MVPIPLTVIGGYLGSGKTTLLNQIIATGEHKRVALIVNDFGAINVDAALLNSASEDTWEVANGCVCCDLSDGMATAIDRISALDPAPEHVFVEVSGVGDPGVVARWGDLPRFTRGGALVCVDVTTIDQRIRNRWVGDTVTAQLTSGDALVLTKTDLASLNEVDRVRNRLRAITNDLMQFTPDEAINRVARGGSLSEVPRKATKALDSASTVHRSWTLAIPEATDPERLSRLIAKLPDGFVRVKGIVPTNQGSAEINFDGARCTVVSSDKQLSETGSLVLIALNDGQNHDAALDALNAAVPGSRSTASPSPIPT